MTTDPIRRQHETTSIPELQGAKCTEFRAVTRDEDERISLMFLELAGTWHRFYLDAGLLHWEEGIAPDPDEDILDGESYTDFADSLRVVNVPIERIEMRDSKLLLRFANGANIIFRNGVDEDDTEVTELLPGKR